MQKQPLEKIILGLDPGTQVTGYGLIQIVGTKISLIQYGVIELKKYATMELRMKKIFERVLALVDEYHPDEVALEAPFFGENVQSMLKLGRAQGIAMAAALYREIPITEYAPRRVKQAVTGNGNASKEQVAKMVQQELNIKEVHQFFDATDALAVAMCHHFSRKTKGKNVKGWAEFLKANPDKLKR